MGQPIDVYREGYEQGKKHTVGGALAKAAIRTLRDDPDGYFAAGYHDGAAGKNSSPPGAGERKQAAELNPFDDKVAIKTVCPNWGALDWFEWKCLGRLKDPICDGTWYVGSGAYATIQIPAAFGAGSRFTKYLTSGISGEGAWIAKAMAWFIGTILGISIRLEFRLLMIPIQRLWASASPIRVRLRSSVGSLRLPPSPPLWESFIMNFSTSDSIATHLRIWARPVSPPTDHLASEGYFQLNRTKTRLA